MKLPGIGKQDDLASEDEGPMIEKPGVWVPKKEIGLLENLLEKMLKHIQMTPDMLFRP
jgi:serine/threonine-protein kinase SRPK3